MSNTQGMNLISEMMQSLKGIKAHTVKSNWGSVVQLDFGKVITTSEGYNESEYGLMLWNCAWRVETKDEPLIACEDDRGELVAGIKKLENLIIKSIAVVPPSLDLIIDFETGFRLHVFSRGSEESDQWSFHLPNKSAFSIKGKGFWEYVESAE